MDPIRDEFGRVTITCKYCNQPFKAQRRTAKYCDVCSQAGRQADCRKRKSLETFKQSLTDESKADFIQRAQRLQVELKRMADEEIGRLIENFKKSETDKTLDETDKLESQIDLINDIENLDISLQNASSISVDILRIIYTNFIALRDQECNDLYDGVDGLPENGLPKITFESDDDFEDDELE